jgi:hypothetical protein
MRLVFKAAVVFAIVATAFLGMPVSAGTIIFEDNFDGHTGGDLLSSYTPPIGASYEGPWKIIKDGGVGGTDYTGQSTYVDNQSMYISSAHTTAIAGRKVQFNFDYFAMPHATSGSDIVSFDAGSGAYTGRGWDILLYGNGSIQYYDADVTENGGYVNVAPAGTFTTYDWVPVKVVADYGTHTFDATVDGYSFSGAWEAAGGSTFQKTLFAANGSNLFYIDNLKIQSPPPIPEPSTLVLTSVGVFGLLAYAWRKRKS